MSSSNSKPASSSASKSKSKAKASDSENPSSQIFTPAMKDRQARNKDPYGAGDRGANQDSYDRDRFDEYGNDTYENTQMRRAAAAILDNPEILMMHASARFDSIPGTRNHFTKILCGFFDESTAKDKLLDNITEDTKNENLKKWRYDESE